MKLSSFFLKKDIKFLLDNVVSFLYFQVVALNVTAEWSSWGKYGNCSRPCGGGLANKTRTCLGASHTCTGTNIRYKICNTVVCFFFAWYSTTVTPYTGSCPDKQLTVVFFYLIERNEHMFFPYIIL